MSKYRYTITVDIEMDNDHPEMFCTTEGSEVCSDGCGGDCESILSGKLRDWLSGKAEHGTVELYSSHMERLVDGE